MNSLFLLEIPRVHKAFCPSKKDEKSFLFQISSVFSKKHSNRSKGYCASMCHTLCKTIGALVQCAVLSLLMTQSGVVNAEDSVDRQAVYQIDLPRQSVAQSLSDLSEQVNRMLLFSYEEVGQLSANPIVGRYTLQEALKIVLRGTGFSGSLTKKGVLMISKSESSDSLKQTEGKRKMKTKKHVLAAVIGSFLGGVVGAEEGASGDEMEWLLEEITVTATRRDTSAQDTPMALKLFDGKVLDTQGADGFEDYIATIPGASFRDAGNGSKRIALRGISNVSGSDFGSGSTVSTVGIYLGDVAIQGTSLLPDLSLYDLNRVEVLKGPQGTLYGEGAAGGAIKMILNSPGSEAFGGKFDTTLSATKEGGLNYRTRGMLNVPISENTALRMVGTYREDDGFVDNIATGEDDYDSESAYSFRVLLGSQLTDKFSLEILALFDVAETDGFPQIDTTLEGLEVSNLTNQFTDSKTSLYGVTLKYEMEFAEFTSVSSYYEFDQEKQVFNPQDGFLSAFGLPLVQLHSLSDNKLETFAQEIRLVSIGDNRLDWIVGGYYRDKEQNSAFESFYPEEADLAAINAVFVGLGFNPHPARVFNIIPASDDFEQAAVYGEVNFALTERLELTTGLRWYEEELSTSVTSIFTGPFAFASSIDLRHEGTTDGILPKVALAFSVTDDHLLYISASEGFRSSAPNTTFSEGSPLSLGQPIVDAESIWNYELGAKTVWAEGRVQLNANLFFIDWSDIQAREEGINGLGFLGSFLGNGGDGEIRGFEFDAKAVLGDSLEVGASFGYTDSELVKTTSSALKGQSLPNIPDWTVNAYGEYRFDLSTLGKGYIRVDMVYVDEQRTQFILAGTSDPLQLDKYTIGNIQAGLNFANKWNVSAFVNNVWDERAELGRGLALNNSAKDNRSRISISQPRTFGVTVGYDF